MKDTLGCVKCASRRVIEIKGSSMNQNTVIAYGSWKMNMVPVNRFICLQCGYTEEYVKLTPKFVQWGEKQIEKQGGDFDGYV